MRSDAFRSRKEHGSGLKLARELADLESKTGKAYKRREELHKQAEANRAYSHFLR
jgi:small subunit ribosomal protein S7